MNETLDLLNTIAQSLYDRKGFNILALDVRSISDLTDYCVIVEGNVDRHVKALSRYVNDAAREKSVKPFFVEGEVDGDWIVIDFGEIVVHIMVPEMRQRYALEQLWKAGQIVDLAIDVSKSDAIGYGD